MGDSRSACGLRKGGAEQILATANLRPPSYARADNGARVLNARSE